MTTRPVTTSQARPDADLAAHLRTWDDAQLAHLLTIRPDLASPPPSSITALAARAGSRTSIIRAMGGLNRPMLTVAEALAVLATEKAPVSLAALGDAVGFAADDDVGHLVDRALVLGSPEALWLVEAAREVLNDGPLGLGPPLHALGLRPAEGWPTTEPAAQAALEQVPEAARKVLGTLIWGPPAGSFEQMPQPVRDLLQARLLHLDSPTKVVLPREVALALRGRRLAREIPLSAPLAPAPERAAAVVAAESARAGEEITHQIDLLISTWAQKPPGVLRTGGLGVRDLRALAEVLGSDAARAALVAELAGMTGLLGQHLDADGSSWAPTAAALDRPPAPGTEELAQRWAALVRAWLASARTPWLVGTRSDKGELRSALSPDLQRSWAPHLRRRVLQALARWPSGAAPEPEAVHAHLAWHTPRSAPPLETVEAVLAEAAAVGLTGAGALSTSARTLLDTGGTLTQVAAAFAADLPPVVSELFIQADLTAVVPGRPDPALATLLERTGEIESRGSALTVRFTSGSIRGALDAGWDEQRIRTELAAYSRTGLPQPLEYLIGDTARTHAPMHVGAARSYLRADDDATLPMLVTDRRLDHLGLRLLAPTVAIARAEPGDLLAGLQEVGRTALAEGPDGQVVALGGRQVRATSSARGLAATHPTDDADPDHLADLIAGMRTGEDRVLANGDGHTEDPVYALELLRQAAGSGTEVEMVVAGSGGAAQRHRVRPLSVVAGRVRALDVGRQTEVTVAAHRIVRVAAP